MHWTEMAENETALLLPCRLRFEDKGGAYLAKSLPTKSDA